jgi:hypothetical protein
MTEIILQVRLHGPIVHDCFRPKETLAHIGAIGRYETKTMHVPCDESLRAHAEVQEAL